MAIQIIELGPEERKNLHDILMKRCLGGDRYAFALALHRDLGWPMLALTEDAIIRHVLLLESAEDRYWDVRGPLLNEQEIGQPVGVSWPFNMRRVAESDLLAIQSVKKTEIDFISRQAQALWPDLPWKENTLRRRIMSFAKDLERISRKYKLWICGSIPTDLPAIAEGEGDELGYRLPVGLDGGYTINRILE